MLRSICFDCARPAALARFWAAALGDYAVRPYDEDELARLRERGIDDPEDDPAVVLDPVSGAGPTIWFTKVPEPKAGKNRVHLDVDVGDEGGVRRLVERGARVLREPGGDVEWWVLADPEGNEFCAFAASGG